MTIVLSEIEFTNDFFSTTLSDNRTIIINKVNEDFECSSGQHTCTIDSLLIQILDTDGETLADCTRIVGMSDDYISINTDYPEYEGQMLSSENMNYCEVEVYEQ